MSTPSSRPDLATKLLAACESGNLAEVEKSLAAGADPRLGLDDASPDYNGALRFAARSGRVAVVKRLLADPRVDPNAHPLGLQPALAVACEHGHAEVALALLDDPRTDPSLKGSLAFRHAVIGGHLAVVDMILRHRRAPASADCTVALSSALQGRHVMLALRLLDDPRVIPNGHPPELPSPLAAAVALGSVPLVEKLISRGCDPRSGDCEAFLSALRADSAEAVCCMLRCHVDLRCHFSLQFWREAVRFGGSESFRHLASLLHGDDDGLRARIVLENAMQCNNIGAVDAVLSYSPAGSPLPSQALLLAAEAGHPAASPHLLKDPRVDPCYSECAPLRTALRKGHAAVVAALQADPRMAFLAACKAGDLGTVESLLASAGTARLINPAAANGQALRDAAAAGNSNLVKLLLADPRVSPDAAAIQQAAQAGHAAVLELLLAADTACPAEAKDEALLLAAMTLQWSCSSHSAAQILLQATARRCEQRQTVDTTQLFERFSNIRP